MATISIHNLSPLAVPLNDDDELPMVSINTVPLDTKKMKVKDLVPYLANHGIVGPPGPKGDQGAQGIQGPKGDQGIQGPQGIQGIQGIKGDTGSIGPQGLQGPQGKDGEPGEKGDLGPQGFTGEPGSIGPEGPQGPPGETTTLVGSFGISKKPNQLPTNGFLPKDWDSPGNPRQDIQLTTGQGLSYTGVAKTDPLYGHVFAYVGIALTNAGWVDCGDITGPEGPIGPQGEPGPSGPRGEQGEKGDEGPQGPEGPAGGNLQLFTTKGAATYEFNSESSTNYVMVTDNPGKRTCIVLGKDCAPVGASIGISAVGSGDVQILTDGTVDLNTNITGAVLDNNISYTIVQYKANKWALRGANRHVFPETIPCMKLVQPTNGKGAWTPNAAQAGIYNCGDVKPSKVWFYASRVSTGAIAESQALSGASLAASFANLVGGEFYDFYAAYEYGVDKKLTTACPPIRYKVQAAFEAPTILTATAIDGNCFIKFGRGNEWQGVEPTAYKYKATCPGQTDRTGDLFDPQQEPLSWTGTIPLGGVKGTWSVQIYLVYGTYGNSPLSSAKTVVIP